MPCFHPLTAYQTALGEVVFHDRLRRYDVVKTLTLPCGQCVGCRLERSRQWAMRCLHEASLHEQNCFITLTYDQAQLPANSSLDYTQFQKFLKRLRKHFEPHQVRFYMGGEYGDQFGRPHFHACLFGIDFPDRVYFKTSPSGEKIWTSQILSRLWPFGFSSVGDVTFESAAYVARYIMQKVTGHSAKAHYERVDPETGEITSRRPEFNKMSLKPGIGARWLEKFRSDVYPHDYVVIRGKEVKPPKYYDRQYAKTHPEQWEELQWLRTLDAQTRAGDNTDARLLVKEQVVKARIQSLKRTLS